MRCIAVILAGGSGNRFGADKPKQFLAMPDGRTILEHSVEAFARCESIDEVCVVSRIDWMDYVKELLVNVPKVKQIVPGGKERYHSTLSALQAYHSDNDILLIHDAVRPYISQQVIIRCCEWMRTHDACAVGVPTTDTIWVSDEGHIRSVPNRRTLVNAQTPQCFRIGILRDAFDKALRDPDFLPTDDCSVLLAYRADVPIEIIEGNTDNIKITYPGDIH